MPANVVKTPRDEHLWNKAKKLAAKQGRTEDWAYIQGIYQKMQGKSLIKAYLIPPAFKTQRVPGQVPDLEAIRLQKEVEKPPKEFSVARLLAHDDPILKVEAIAQNLGFDIQTENGWSTFLGDVLTGGNEVSIRKAVLSKCIEEKLDPALRRAILARSLSYWRGKMRKSLIEVVSPDDLAKSGRYITKSELALYTKENIKKVEDNRGYAGKVTLNELKAAGGQMKLYIDLEKSEARGGTYYRKVPKKKGKGDNYYYTREDYNKSKQAHTSGQDNEKSYLSGKVQGCIAKAGEKGCDVAGFEELVKKYGAKKVATSLREGKDGYEFKKGRFYGKIKVEGK